MPKNNAVSPHQRLAGLPPPANGRIGIRKQGELSDSAAERSLLITQPRCSSIAARASFREKRQGARTESIPSSSTST
jgi:hypothetical protein